MSQIKLTADSGGGTTSLKAPSSTTSNADVVLKLPVADGSANQVLKTDGSGQLSFTSNAGTTINNNATTKFITGTDNANELDCEANLSYNNSVVTFSSSNLSIDKSTNPTIAAKETAGNKEVQLRANTTGGLLRTIGSYPLVLGTNQTERLRIDSDGRLFLNTTAVTNTSDQLTVKKPASGFGEIGLTVDANTSTNSAANAFVYTKSKHTYWNGYAFQSSHGYIGALLGKRDASGTTDQEIRMEIGGDSPNQNEEKTWTFQNDGDLSIDDGNLKLASGHGIDFSATANTSASNASMQNELFADYEVGTWHPVIRFYNSGTWSDATMTTQGTRTGCHYVKIGNMCFFHLGWDGFEVSNSSYAVIGGLPFASNGRGSAVVNYTNLFSNHQDQAGHISLSSAEQMEFYRNGNSWNSFQNNQSNRYIYADGFYKVA